MKPPPICPRCGKPATRRTGPYGPWHECCGLRAWGDDQIVDKATNIARARAHNTFDRLWRDGMMSRGEAYLELARQMKMTTNQCHFSMMTHDQAVRANNCATEIMFRLKHKKMRNAGKR